MAPARSRRASRSSTPWTTLAGRLPLQDLLDAGALAQPARGEAVGKGGAERAGGGEPPGLLFDALWEGRERDEPHVLRLVDRAAALRDDGRADAQQQGEAEGLARLQLYADWAAFCTMGARVGDQEGAAFEASE